MTAVTLTVARPVMQLFKSPLLHAAESLHSISAAGPDPSFFLVPHLLANSSSKAQTDVVGSRLFHLLLHLPRPQPAIQQLQALHYQMNKVVLFGFWKAPSVPCYWKITLRAAELSKKCTSLFTLNSQISFSESLNCDFCGMQKHLCDNLMERVTLSRFSAIPISAPYWLPPTGIASRYLFSRLDLL